MAHLGVAGELYGEDYQRRVDSLAQRAMADRGSLDSLDDVVTEVLGARDEPPSPRA